MTAPMTPKEQKKLLRPVCKQIRKAVPDKPHKTAKIMKALCSLPAFRNANVILSYYGVGDEVATAAILETALQSGKRVGVPRCYEESRMEFLEIRHLRELSSLSPFGIPEAPDGTAVIDPQEADLILVPALAFAKDGARIGYGKGYYDRYLKRCSAHTVGLCFEDCLRDTLPVNQNDRRVQQIITEEQIISLSNTFHPEVSYGREQNPD